MGHLVGTPGVDPIHRLKRRAAQTSREAMYPGGIAINTKAGT